MNELVKLEEYQKALMNAKDIREISKIRAQMEAIAKTIAPRLKLDRYDWSKGYVESCVKHGEFWNSIDDKQIGRPSKKVKKFTVLDAGFKNKMDAMTCSRIANLDSQDIAEYFDDCRTNGRFPTLAGAYGIWKLLQPVEEIEPLPEGVYNVIYADPPWQFDNTGFEQSAASHYPTMATLDIAELPIPEAVILFLWATCAMLEDALFVMNKWGFEYKTHMAWIKDSGPSIGWYLQTRHELLLIGVKETIHPEIKPISWQKFKVSKHSAKPHDFYRLIEAMYDGPYLELFARNEREGWKAWGNEVDV